MRRALSLLALALGVALGGAARADDVADEADFHFRLAAKRYEVGDYDGALEHFLASNRLVPNKNVLFNIARTYEQLKQPADAYRYYARALEGEPDAAVQRRIKEAIARIRPLVALVKVESNPPGATVYVDRRDLGARGKTPLLLALPPGRYAFLAELDAHEPAKTEPMDLKQGSEQTVTLAPVPIYGAVRVVTEPAGAEVRDGRDDGPPLCTTPCDAQLPPGRRVLHLARAGYQGVELPVEVVPKGTVTARATLTAVYGTLLVGADVREALITVDGKTAGFTPAVLTVPVGEHEVRVSSFGYRPSVEKVTVRANEQARLDVELDQAGELTAASRSAEGAEDAPASVTILTGTELRAMGYPTIAEALRGVRGLYVSDDRTYTSIGVRGFSRPGDYGNRVLVTIDGHPSNDNYLGSSFVGFDARCDLDDVERIEIVRGPGSVLYGTGAFFAVINVVTRGRDGRTHAELAGGAAADGVGRGRTTGYVRLGEEGGAWTSVAGAKGVGRDFYFPEYVGDADALARDGTARGLDGFQAGTLQGRAWWRSLTLQWFLHSRDKQLPTGVYASIFGDPRAAVKDTRAFLEARFEPRISKTVESLTRAHANLYHFDGTYPYAPPPGGAGLSRETFRGNWIGGEQRFVFTPIAALRITAGGEVVGHVQAKQSSTDETGAGPSFDTPFVVAAGYALADLTPAKAIKISAGARLDYYSNLQSFDFLGAFNPRIAVVAKPYARGNVKLLAGKAFRAPSVYELFYASPPQQIASQNLRPEQVFSGELEFTHAFSPTVKATAAGYVNYVTQLVELVDAPNMPGLLQYQNAPVPVLIPGFELELRREWRQGWMIGASYSYAHASYLDAPDRRDVPNSLEHLASLKAAVPVVGRALGAMTRVSVEGPRWDGRFEASDPTAQRKTDPGVILDLVFSGEVERLGLRYSAGVYNAADWRYDAVPSGEYRQRTIVQSGRSFLATVALRF
jgi:outer membrane receptor protein involved in Fe transport